jgi:signal transduction histidine kinase
MAPQIGQQPDRTGIPESCSQSRHAVLLRIIRQLTDESNPDVLMRCLLDEAIAMLGGQIGSVCCWSEDEGVLKRMWSTIPLPDGRPVDLRPGEGLGGQAILLRRPVISNAYAEDRRALGVARQVGVRVGIAAPLLRDGELLGAIMVGSRDPSLRFTEKDAEDLEILAGVASSVVAGLRRAKLSGALLAARTAQHLLNNQLGVTMGYADMLADDPRLPPDLHEYAVEIVKSATEAARTVDRMRRVSRLEEAETGLPVGNVINLTRSVDDVAREPEADPSLDSVTVPVGNGEELTCPRA